jgi:acetolactate synthase-1/2/3 large subunit
VRELTVSDYVAEGLSAKGVTHVFEMAGGMIAPLLDSLHRGGRVQIVSTHHEQAAAFAAGAMGAMTGVPGVALATSGPGATNLLTGVGSCHFDSAPAVFITGQVNRHELKGTRAVRQLGFQETDIVSMVGAITKAAWRMHSPEKVPEVLDRAFALSIEGRPGPVLLDIPLDVQLTRIHVPDDVATLSVPVPAAADEAVWDELSNALGSARRPIVLVGGGVRSAGAVEDLRVLVDRLQLPGVCSLLGSDVFAYDDPLRVGMIGSYGNRWANLALGAADLIIVFGSRLDIRQTGADTDSFKGDRPIFHVDLDSSEINNRVQGCRAVVADVGAFVREALARTQKMDPVDRSDWIQQIDELRRSWPDTDEVRTLGVNPNLLMHQLSAASTRAAAYVVDVGQHQMWAAQSLELGAAQRFLTSGGMGAMGYALPSAVGVAAAVAPQPVVLVAGDGGFQTNIQELQTVVRNSLPVKMVILNNHCHGMVRQFQQSFFRERYQSTLWGYSAPDFGALAAAYGIPGRVVEGVDDVESGIAWLWNDPNEPALMAVEIDTYANVYPKLAFGKPLTEMEPFAKPVGIEGT